MVNYFDLGIAVGQRFYILSASVYMNGREYKGQAPGSFVGLDLAENMHIGAVPDFHKISRLAGYSRGFVGRYTYCC